MQISTRNKTKMTSIIVIVLLMASITLMANMAVQAQTGMPTAPGSGISGALPSGVTPSITVDTKAWLSFRPNPIGVGQTLLVNMWTTSPVSPMRYHQGYTVTITKPNGDKVVVGPMNSYAADATAWFEYVVDQVGTWKLKFEFSGEYYPAGRWFDGYIVANTSSSGYFLDSAYYEPCSTAEQELVVQNEIVYSWPQSALPNDYWTRPAHLENRDWWPILGNFPAFGLVGSSDDPYWPADTNPYIAGYNFVPYVQAPNTGHILWKRQGADAGIIGGTAGAYSTSGNPGVPSVIYNGRCYQTMTIPVNGVPTSCAVSYDLRTGAQYYAIPTAQGGVTPQVISYTRATAVAVAGATEANTYSVDLLSLSGNRLIKINPWTGAVTLNVTGLTPQLIGGVQGGSSYGGFYDDPYVLSMQTVGSGATQKTFLIKWSTAGTSTDFASRVIKNITVPFTLPTYPGGILGYAGYSFDFENDIAVWMVGLAPTGIGVYYGTYMQAISMDTGALLWNKTYSDTRYSTSCFVADHGKVAVLMEHGFYEAFDIRTGNVAWKSEVMAYPWGSDSFGAYAYQSAYGLLYRQSYDGVYAFNWTNGKIVWRYTDYTVPFETPYTDENGLPVNSFNAGGMIADGKLYTYNTEHTPTYPRTRGWKLHCINATSGEGIWTMTGAQTPAAIADGYLVASNPDDGHMYVYGKGKSAATVEGPLTTITLGQKVVLKGTVLDQSPAQPGTPCVSKESMTTQMEYLHMQLPIGGIWNNVTMTGVPVSLDVLDSNNNWVHIGDVTTDAYSGTFGFTWEPEITGQYQVVATFMGDDSYGSSSATTYVSVTDAPPATPTPEPQVIPDTTPMFVVSTVAIIIAIAIATLLLLRRKS